MRCILTALLIFAILSVGSQARGEEEVFGRLGPLGVLGDGDGTLEFGGGIFNYDNGDAGTSAAVKLEYRFGRKLGFVGPALGIVANDDGGVIGYGGLYADLALWRLVLTPLFGVGAYHEGSGKDLGGTLEFRSSLGLFYALPKGGRIGASAAHVSNADLHDENPGENDFFLSYVFTF